MTPRIYKFLRARRCNMCDAGIDEQVFWGRRLDGRQGFSPRAQGGVAVSIVRCKTCSLTYPNPMPVPDMIADHYDVLPEDYWPPSFFERELDYRPHAERFERLTGLKAASCSALDIGAGIGKGMTALTRLGFDTYGLEPSPAFRAFAIERARIREDRLLLGSVEDARFSDEQFDLIVFGAVLEHLPDPAGAVEKALGWLSPPGVMYIEVPSAAWLMSRLMRRFYRSTGGEWVINTSPMHPPYHLYEFGYESFRLHGRRVGYTVVEHEITTCSTYAPRILAPALSGVMRITGTGMQLAVWIRSAA